jgi:hypothetical protein
MMAEAMPGGYVFVPQPNEVADAVLSRSTWAVLGLTLHIELFSQAHYRESIEPDADASELWKDIFMYHWREESQHAILDELEWRREDARVDAAQRDRAVDDLIALVGAVDGLLQLQAAADTDYFLRICGRPFEARHVEALRDTFLKAYRWQYILSGAQHEHFLAVLGELVTEAQMQRIGNALAPLAA